MDEQYYILMAKVLSNEASEAELQELNSWLNADAANMKAYKNMKALWKNADEMLQQPEFEVAPAWNKVAAKTIHLAEPARTKTIAFPSWLKFSAAAALLVGAIAGFRFWSGNQEMTVLAMNAGEVVELPDHSKVTLTKGSAIHYPKNFSSNKRNVTLDGEAFFEVTRNEKAPFVIDAHSVNVQVLGTSFNVIADDTTARVVVATGKVQVSAHNDPGMQVVLTPGEKVIYRSNQLVESLDTNATYYRTGRALFTQKPFDQIVAVMSKVKDTSISLDPALPQPVQQQLLDFTFDKSQSVEEMLNDICMISGTRWVKKGGSYTITAK